jgi:phage tail-like protein
MSDFGIDVEASASVEVGPDGVKADAEVKVEAGEKEDEDKGGDEGGDDDKGGDDDAGGDDAGGDDANNDDGGEETKDKASQPQRAYVASHFALDLDGMGVLGFLRSFDGGGVKTDIMSYQHGAMIDAWRQVGRLKYDDMTIQVGMGMSDKFYDWMSSFFTRDIQRKDGAIVIADFNYKQKAKRTFENALISEVTIPALDGSSKDAAYMTVKIVPESMGYEAIKGKESTKLDCAPGLKQPNKLWLCSNFKFTIDGFEENFKRVLKIDSFTIKQQILEYPHGNRRTVRRVPGRVDFPNIAVYVPLVDALELMDQVNSRLITYDAPDDENGMTGSLEFIGTDDSTLCTINLTGVDITSAEHQKYDAGGDAFAMVKLQIQVETMELDYEDDAVAEDQE